MPFQRADQGDAGHMGHNDLPEREEVEGGSENVTFLREGRVGFWEQGNLNETSFWSTHRSKLSTSSRCR